MYVCMYVCMYVHNVERDKRKELMQWSEMHEG